MDDLATLRERLAEISDLSRAAGVLGWEQRVSMPPLGTESRAESLATLGRIIHDRFTDPEIGRLLERLAPLEESLPYDSDDASLIRVTRRDWEKACRVPTELRVEMTRAAASGHHAWVEARRERRLRLVPPLPARRTSSSSAATSSASSRPTCPTRRCSTTTSPGMTTTEVREVFATLRPALTELVRNAPQVDASFLHGSFDPDAQRRFAERVVGDARLRGGRLAPRPDRAPVLHVVLEPRRPADDALPAGRPRVGLVDAARGGPRALRPRHRRLADAHAARRRAVARDQRVAEPDLGEPRRPQPPVLDVLVRTIAGDVPGAARRRRPRRLRARDQPRRAGPDPRRRRRDDLLAPHHPPLRARAGADRRHRGARGPPRDLERPHEGVPRRRRALGHATACSRTCTGRAAGSATSRPTRSAT